MPDTYNYPLRLPAALAERVKRDARDARRSFNAQVIYELDRKRRTPPRPAPAKPERPKRKHVRPAPAPATDKRAALAAIDNALAGSRSTHSA